MLPRLILSFSAQIAGLTLSIIERIAITGLLIRLWGLNLYSDWAAITALVALLSISDCGLQVYFGNCMQKAHFSKDEVAFQRIVSISLFSYGVVASAMLLLSPLLFICVNPVRLMSLLVLHGQAAVLTTAVMFVWSVSYVSRGSITQIYRGRGDFARTTFMSYWARITIALVTICVALLGQGVLLLSVFYVLVDVVVGWGSLVWDLRRKLPQLRLSFAKPTRAELNEIVAHSKWYTLSMVAPILWTNAPVLLIGQFGLGGRPLVAFVTARTLVNLIRQTSTLAGLSVGVELAHSRYTFDPSIQARTVAGLGAVITAVSSVAVAGVMIFAPGLLQFWTGKAGLFEPITLGALLAPVLFLGPVVPLANMLTFANAPRLPAIANAGQIGVGFLLGLLLTPRWGILGLAVGLAIGEVLAQYLVILWLGRRSVTVPVSPYLKRCLLVGAASSSWSALIAWICNQIFPQMRLENLILDILIWAPVALGPAIVLSLLSEQRKRVIAYVIESRFLPYTSRR